MSLSDKIAIASAIITFSGFTIKGAIIYIKSNRDKMKAVVINPYIRTLFLIFIFSIGFALIPWDKFHFGSEKTKIVYVDSSRLKHKNLEPASNRLIIKDSLNVPLKLTDQKSHSRHINLTQKKVLESVKVDSPKKEDKQDNSTTVQSSPNAHVVGGVGNNVGINGDYIVNPEKKLPEDFLLLIFNTIDNLVKNKGFDRNEISVYPEPYCNAPNIPSQIITYIRDRGYFVGTGILADNQPTINGIRIDTSNKKLTILVGVFK